MTPMTPNVMAEADGDEHEDRAEAQAEKERFDADLVVAGGGPFSLDRVLFGRRRLRAEETASERVELESSRSSDTQEAVGEGRRS